MKAPLLNMLAIVAVYSGLLFVPDSEAQQSAQISDAQKRAIGISLNELKIVRATPADAVKLWGQATKKYDVKKKGLSYDFSTITPTLGAPKSIYVTLELKNVRADAALSAIAAEIEKSGAWTMNVSYGADPIHPVDVTIALHAK